MYKRNIEEANQALHRKFNTVAGTKLTKAKQKYLEKLDRYHVRSISGK